MRLAAIRSQHVRFGFSPARECLRGIAVLLRPKKHAEQTPWLREARYRLPRHLRRTIEHFRFFFEPRTEVFPFVWDYNGRPSFESELGALRASLPSFRDVVARRLSERRLLDADELQRMRRSGYRKMVERFVERHPNAGPMLARFLDSPNECLRDFCRMLDEFHAHVFAPAWEPIDARLVADIDMRRKILSDFGIAALLRTLAADIGVHRTPSGASIELSDSEGELTLDAHSTLTLTPSFFCWPGHEVFIVRLPRGLQGTIAYPVPPLTTRAARIGEGRAVADACAALGNAVRLRIVELLNARDLSTRELAGYLKIEEPVASRHLRTLSRAGLVQRRRSGYFVMYSLNRATISQIIAALSVLG